jgi:hypothetical protein
LETTEAECSLAIEILSIADEREENPAHGVDVEIQKETNDGPTYDSKVEQA